MRKYNKNDARTPEDILLEITVVENVKCSAIENKLKMLSFKIGDRNETFNILPSGYLID